MRSSAVPRAMAVVFRRDSTTHQLVMRALGLDSHQHRQQTHRQQTDRQTRGKGIKRTSIYLSTEQSLIKLMSRALPVRFVNFKNNRGDSDTFVSVHLKEQEADNDEKRLFAWMCVYVCLQSAGCEPEDNTGYLPCECLSWGTHATVWLSSQSWEPPTAREINIFSMTM